MRQISTRRHRPTPRSTSTRPRCARRSIRLDLPFASADGAAARGLPQARIAAADRIVQDSRRVERGAQAVAGADAGRRVDGERRQRRARRRVRGAPRRRAVLGDGDGHRAARPSCARSNASAPRSSRPTYDECWKTVESHASPRMRGHFVHPFDDDDFIAGNGTAGLEILEDLPDVDAVVARARRRRPAVRHRHR